MFASAMMMAPTVSGGAIQFVGRSGVSYGGTGSGTWIFDLTTLSGGIDTQPRNGDTVYLLSMATVSGHRTPVTSGYTETGTGVFRKRMGVSPDTSVTLPVSGHNQYAQVAFAMVFRGVHAASPEDVATVTVSTDDPGSNTPITPGALGLVMGVGENASGGVDTLTSPDLSPFYSQDSGDTRSISGGAGLHTGWTSGAIDPAAWVDTGGLYSAWVINTIILRPA